MKAFGFRPKLYTALKNYSKELFMADLMAGIIVGIVALPLAIAFGIASGWECSSWELSLSLSPIPSS